MNIFPVKKQYFKLIGSQTEALDRLNRRTDKSKNLTSQFTDKTFRGMVNGNRFKIISSVIGKGAFCVMTGKLNKGKGYVKIEIHNVFQILLSIILLFPIVGLFLNIGLETEEFSTILLLVTIGQILVIRYFLISFVFSRLSKESLRQLQDVLDFEWIKNGN